MSLCVAEKFEARCGICFQGDVCVATTGRIAEHRLACITNKQRREARGREQVDK